MWTCWCRMALISTLRKFKMLSLLKKIEKQGNRPGPAGHFIWPLMAKKNEALNGRNGREIIKMASPMANFYENV